MNLIPGSQPSGDRIADSPEGLSGNPEIKIEVILKIPDFLA